MFGNVLLCHWCFCENLYRHSMPFFNEAVSVNVCMLTGEGSTMLLCFVVMVMVVGKIWSWRWRTLYLSQSSCHCQNEGPVHLTHLLTMLQHLWLHLCAAAASPPSPYPSLWQFIHSGHCRHEVVQVDDLPPHSHSTYYNYAYGQKIQQMCLNYVLVLQIIQWQCAWIKNFFLLNCCS